MKSIYLKNLLLLSGMVIISFLIFGISFVVIMRNYAIDEKRDNMQQSAKQISEIVALNVEAYYPTPITGSRLYDSINAYNILAGTSYTFIANESGTIITCSENGGVDGHTCDHLGQQLDSDIVKSMQLGTYTRDTSLNGILGLPHYVVGCPIVVRGDVIGYALVVADMSTATEAWGSFAALFFFVAIAVIGVSFFIAMFMARFQAAPMREMSNATNKFAHGDFSVRVNDRGRVDEIGELIHSFNSMADALEKSENLRRDFVANVSHELKTPMTSITGFTEGLIDGTIPKDRQDEYLAIIASETKRLSRLVRSMLDASQVQALEAENVLRESFDICEVMRRALVTLESKINAKGLDVRAEIPDTPLMVGGKADSITQVVYNLLDNAIKFSDAGSEIGLSARKTGDKVFVTVRNQGEAILEEELPLIFDRFHKTDKSRSNDKDGVGLGLHIVKTIINSHGENIYVKSEDRITEFTFTLTARKK